MLLIPYERMYGIPLAESFRLIVLVLPRSSNEVTGYA